MRTKYLIGVVMMGLLLSSGAWAQTQSAQKETKKTETQQMHARHGVRSRTALRAGLRRGRRGGRRRHRRPRRSMAMAARGRFHHFAARMRHNFHRRHFS
ncbi:MAG TPA: hypothetical protein VKS81_07315 [Bacteroidota bacterium]|nr:hypothetical protein [Bacteroidota bacterium]